MPYLWLSGGKILADGQQLINCPDCPTCLDLPCPADCPDCCDAFTLTISGFTGDCAAYNGEYTFTRTGTACSWELATQPAAVFTAGNIDCLDRVWRIELDCPSGGGLQALRANTCDCPPTDNLWEFHILGVDCPYLCSETGSGTLSCGSASGCSGPEYLAIAGYTPGDLDFGACNNSQYSPLPEWDGKFLCSLAWGPGPEPDDWNATGVPPAGGGPPTACIYGVAMSTVSLFLDEGLGEWRITLNYNRYIFGNTDGLAYRKTTNLCSPMGTYTKLPGYCGFGPSTLVIEESTP